MKLTLKVTYDAKYDEIEVRCGDHRIATVKNSSRYGPSDLEMCTSKTERKEIEEEICSKTMADIFYMNTFRSFQI